MSRADGGAPDRRSSLTLAWRPYRFSLPQALVTAQGALAQRQGWLLRLEAENGALGWGEAALLPPTDPEPVERAIAALPAQAGRGALEAWLPAQPLPVQAALGLALAELDGLGAASGGGWRPAPASAVLLPAGPAMLNALDQALSQHLTLPATTQPGIQPGDGPSPPIQPPLTVKWKVAAADPALERSLLETLLDRLPPEARLRLDANGGWDRSTAWRWAERLIEEERLDWLEQPLTPEDRSGLWELGARLPVALDESLRADPSLAASWPGWLVRRPLLEGDPRPLLAALAEGRPRWMVSTAFETGIGWRLVAHLAALQRLGPTPCAPGLAPGWRPNGGLFAAEPERVWEAARWT